MIRSGLRRRVCDGVEWRMSHADRRGHSDGHSTRRTTPTGSVDSDRCSSRLVPPSTSGQQNRKTLGISLGSSGESVRAGLAPESGMKERGMRYRYSVSFESDSRASPARKFVGFGRPRGCRFCDRPAPADWHLGATAAARPNRTAAAPCERSLPCPQPSIPACARAPSPLLSCPL